MNESKLTDPDGVDVQDLSDLKVDKSEVAHGNEYFQKIGELLEPKLLALRDSVHKFKVLTTCAGGGAGIAELLSHIPGSTQYFLRGDFPNDPGARHQFARGRTLIDGVTERNAIILAAQSYLNAQGIIWRGGNGRVEENPYVLGVGATADIATLDELQPEKHQIWGAVRTLEGVSTYHVEFLKGQGPQDRAWQNNMCNLLIANSVLAAAGHPQVPIECDRLQSNNLVPDPNGSDGLVLQLKPIIFDSSKIESELNKNNGVLLVHPDGTFGSTDEIKKLKSEPFSMAPGSYNPIHVGHETVGHAA